MSFPLKQSTASQEIPLGPYVDDTDGKTAETALSIANTDIKIWKSGGTTEASKNSGGATHIASGRYYAVLDATDTDTAGPLRVSTHISGALPVWLDCIVYVTNVYDSLFAGSDRLQVHTDEITAALITATTIASDAITDAKVASDVTIASVTGSVGSVTGAVGSVTGAVGSVTGSVGSVTGAVGSVTGNVGGNVTGSVGSVVGATGSVTGAVGSVTGNVGGNVTGSVGSVAAGGIAASSFAAGAIDATAIATNAIDADALAADAVTEIWAKACTEPTAVVAASPTAIAALSWLNTVSRNKITQTSTSQILKADDGSTTIATSTVSDDLTTFTRGEFA